MKYLLTLLFAFRVAALASTSSLTIDNTTGKVNVPAGLIPNFTALTVGNNWVPMLPTPQGYGAIADGQSHPLSNKYASLSAAQLVYPFATSLTQELDYCGLQSCANLGSFYIPPGMYLLGNSTLRIVNDVRTGGQSLVGDGITIVGAGPELTTINANGGADAIHILGRYQNLRDMTIAGTAYPAQQLMSRGNGVTLGEGNYGNHFHLVHVTIRNFNIGFNNPNSWDGCSVENSYLNNNFCGAFTDSNQDILRFTGTSIGNDSRTFSATGGTTTSGSNMVSISSTVGIFAGATISGAGIPSFTKVVGVTDGRTLVLSANATDTADGVTLQVSTIGLAVNGSGSAEWNGGVSGGNGVSIAATDVRASNVHFELADQTYITGSAMNNRVMLDNCHFADGNGAYRHVEIVYGKAVITHCSAYNPGLAGGNGRVYVYVGGGADVRSPDHSAIEDYNGVAKVICGDYVIQTGDNPLPPPDESYRGIRYYQAYGIGWSQPDAIYTCLNVGGTYAWVKDATAFNPQQLVPQPRPAAPQEGSIYSDAADHHLYFYNGTIWKQLDN